MDVPKQLSRRLLLRSSAVAFAATGSWGQLIGSVSTAEAKSCKKRFTGYGELKADPKGLLDLPHGFQYRAFSRDGEALSDGSIVPSGHDGMASFSAGQGANYLVRNHELETEDVVEDGLYPVAHKAGLVYDPDAVGGTTTLLVGANRKLISHQVSLAGTANNCAGGPTPWGTWLSCEETVEVLSKPHGYVFEVHPVSGGNPLPIVGMGRFEHEAVAFDQAGIAYLTEDAGGPHGCFYRFLPNKICGLGSLHAGGTLQAMSVLGLGTDLSIVQTPGLVLPVTWIDVPNPDPGEHDTPVREQVNALGATPIQECEGAWTDRHGVVWFVASRGDGPDAEDEEDVSAAEHAGQIWKYDPKSETIELVVVFQRGTPYDEPDNITVGPHGFALACTDGDDDQWLVTVTDEGEVTPFAFNALNEEEFAGACFSEDGKTLFVNTQGPPGITYAIWGPWRS